MCQFASVALLAQLRIIFIQEISSMNTLDHSQGSPNILTTYQLSRYYPFIITIITIENILNKHTKKSYRYLSYIYI
jgi:hypothetical protein